MSTKQQTEKIDMNIQFVFPYGDTGRMHPAYMMHPEELYDKLNEMVSQKLMIRIESSVTDQKDHTYILFHYTAQCEYSHKWNKYSLCGRSIVFRKHNSGKIEIITPGLLKRFEASIQINTSTLIKELRGVPVLVTEKMDGQYVCVVVLENGYPLITSARTFDGNVVTEVRAYMTEHNIFPKMIPRLIYIFEHVKSQVICKYDSVRHGMYLITVIEPTGRIVDRPELEKYATSIGTFIVPIRNFTDITEVLDWSNSINNGYLTTEGVVVEFPNGFGCKVKTPLYYAIMKEKQFLDDKYIKQYIFDGVLPSFRMEENKKTFLAKSEEILKQLFDLMKPICEFINAHTNEKDTDLVRQAIAQKIHKKFIGFIKNRDISEKAIRSMTYIVLK